jgi:two-component system, NtrC family, sensor histidine kinase PilS
MAGGIRSLIHFLHATRQQLPDPRLIIRWVYIGRLSLAAAIFLAALFAWERAPIADTRAASVAFALAMVVTAASAVYSEVQKRPLGRTFLYLQAIFDLLLATAVVHLTGGQESQFAAVYILVIAGASLLLPIGSTLLIALLGCVLYFGDILVGHPGAWTFDLALALQLLVFGIVALGSAYISARLQQVSAGTAELAAELVKVRLQGTDILRNIRSGIISVDEAAAGFA